MAASRWIKIRSRTVTPTGVQYVIGPSWRLSAVAVILRSAAWAIKRL
jgi:hypothetical protein